MSEGTLSRRSFLSGAGASAALLALDAILRRHGGAEAAALRSRMAAASGEAPPGFGTTWQNWSQNLSSNPERVFLPLGRQDLIDVIRRARNKGKRIRVTGSSHSFSPLVPTDDFLVYNRGMRAVSVDKSNPAQPLVTVESGADGADALAEMTPQGVALPTNVVLKSVTYGGLIAAGCHGSGWDNPTLSDLVESMDIIDAAGTVRTYSESDRWRRCDECRTPQPRSVRHHRPDHSSRGARFQRTQHRQDGPDHDGGAPGPRGHRHQP